MILDEKIVNELFDNIKKATRVNSKYEHLVIDNKNPLDFMFISGGSTRFIGLASAAIRLLELGYQPHVYGGISAGSIMLIPLILGKHEEMVNIGLNIKPTDFFKVPPIDDDGKVTWCAIWRLITSKYSLGLQDIKPILKSVVTPEDFKKYQEGNYPDAYILAVNGNTLRRKVWNLRDKSIDYEKYLKITSASSRIPIMTQAEWIDGEPFFDGGMRNHTPSTKILQRYKKIGRVASIFAREEVLNRPSEKWQKNAIEMIFRTIECMSLEISKRDEEIEKLMAIIHKFKHRQFYLDKILDSMYDTDPANLELLRKNAIEEVDDKITDFLA